MFRALSTNQVHDSETQVTDIHGKPRHFWCTAGVAAHDEQGRPNAVVEILRDITERKQNEQARRTLEEQLRQAQKMEAVGPVSYTHLRAHETVLDLVCRLLLEKKKKR